MKSVIPRQGDAGEPTVIGSREPHAINLGRPQDPQTGKIGPKIMYGDVLSSIVFGPSGTGKSTRLLLPNLLAMEANRSVVVIDTKGELAAVSAPFRRKLGEVVILNPFGVLADIPGYADLKSQGFNPLLHIDPGLDSFNAEADILADALVQVATEGNAKHFDSSARSLVGACIMLEVVEARETRRTPSLANVRRNLCTASNEKELEKLVGRMMQSKVWGLQNKASQFTRMSNETSGVINTAIDQTKFLDDIEIARDLDIGTFDMRDLKKRPVTVYLILPPIQIDRHAKWLRLVVAAALKGTMRDRKPGEPFVLFALDEFYSLGHMQIVSTVWSQTRGPALTFMPILQDLNQLKELYPKTYETFAGMCGAVVTFGARDMVTARWFSERAGDTTVLAESRSSGTSSGMSSGGANSGTTESSNWNQLKVPFLGPHRFYEMPTGGAYLWLAGVAETVPAYVPAYHQVKKLAARARANPYHAAKSAASEPPRLRLQHSTPSPTAGIVMQARKGYGEALKSGEAWGVGLKGPHPLHGQKIGPSVDVR